MLDIKKIQSKNECTIVGILNELDIVEGKTSDGRDYIRGTATIRVDQEVKGKQVENLIPVSMFAMRLKRMALRTLFMIKLQIIRSLLHLLRRQKQFHRLQEFLLLAKQQIW